MHWGYIGFPEPTGSVILARQGALLQSSEKNIREIFDEGRGEKSALAEHGWNTGH